MTTKLTLYNGALRELGQRRLSSLSEDREPRRWLDDAWDDQAINAILEEGFWKHASRSVQLNFNPSFVWQFGYRWQFTKPTDLVRLCAICSDQYLESTIDRYLDETGFWYVDVNPIWIQYVSNDPAYGLDYSKWPPTFLLYAERFLARKIAPKFKKTDNEIGALEKLLTMSKRDALSKDAMAGPTMRQKMGSWNRARRGNASMSVDRLRGGRLIG